MNSRGYAIAEAIIGIALAGIVLLVVVTNLAGATKTLQNTIATTREQLSIVRIDRSLYSDIARGSEVIVNDTYFVVNGSRYEHEAGMVRRTYNDRTFGLGRGEAQAMLAEKNDKIYLYVYIDNDYGSFRRKMILD